MHNEALHLVCDGHALQALGHGGGLTHPVGEGAATHAFGAIEVCSQVSEAALAGYFEPLFIPDVLAEDSSGVAVTGESEAFFVCHFCAYELKVLFTFFKASDGFGSMVLSHRQYHEVVSQYSGLHI